MTTTLATTPTSAFHSVRIGGRTFPFTTCEAVSRAYRATIEHLGLGGSETPSCEIFDCSGAVVGNVSYNGRVWPCAARDWQPSIRPIYSPDGFLGDPQDLYRHAFPVGAEVRVDSNGLEGVALRVAEHVTDPDSRRAFYILEHDGNRFPARYDARLLAAA